MNTTSESTMRHTLRSKALLEDVYRKVSSRLVPPLLLAYIVAYLDRVNVGFAKLQMLKDLHFSETIYGLGAGIFFVGYFLFGVPSNLMLHRVGARAWIATLMIAWAFVSAATVFVTTPPAFYALRFLLGVAEAGFFPGVIFYFTQWYPASRRSKITALFMMGIAICGAFGSMLSGWIMQTFNGQGGWSGWQWLFVLEAVPAVLVGLYILVRLNDNLAGAVWLSADERGQLAGELAHDIITRPTGSFADALRDGRLWLACVIYFCAMTGLYGISFWLPTIVSELGFRSPLRIGLLTAIPYAVAGVGMVLVGRSADRTGERRWHVAIPAILGALGLAASAVLSAHAAAAMTALTLATFGILTTPPLFWSLPTAYLRGGAAAAGIAFINSFGCLAGFASPYIVGWIKDATGSTDSGMYVVAALVFAGAVLVLAGIPPRSCSRISPN
jgi:MFS family permease